MLLRLTTVPTTAPLMTLAAIQMRMSMPPSRSGASLRESASFLLSRQSLYQPNSAAGTTNGYIVFAHSTTQYCSPAYAPVSIFKKPRKF